MMVGFLDLTPSGLYCREADIYIDPWRPVKRAVITHAHADHARVGSRFYLCAREGQGLLRYRLGNQADIQPLEYGDTLTINSARITLHPAGHILGSAQVNIDIGGRNCVITGDFKTDPDPTCAPMEPLRCDELVCESTFGLPVFRWPAPEQVFGEINRWWRTNQKRGRTSLLFAYALGKAQRILAGVDASIGPILTHGAVEKINHRYRSAGIDLPETRYIGDVDDRKLFSEALVIAPPSADNPVWMRRFPNRSRAFASGWMRIRGNRRRRAVDRGFVLSDHSDWDGLISTIAASGAERIGLTHGYAAEMARYLTEKGHRAEVVSTDFGTEDESVEGSA